MDHSLNHHHQFNTSDAPDNSSETSFLSGYRAIFGHGQTPVPVGAFEDVTAELVDKSTALLNFLSSSENPLNEAQRDRLEKTLLDISEYIAAIRAAINQV